MYKIRFWGDHFETNNIWAKRKGLSVVIKILSPVDSLPVPGAIYIWWNIKKKKKKKKNVYKIGLRRDHFETCNIWAKSKGLSVVIKFLSPMGCLPLPGTIYMWNKHLKNGKKSDFRDFLNSQQIGKVIRNFCWHQNFVPKGLSVPALGLYTCIKSLKCV